MTRQNRHENRENREERRALLAELRRRVAAIERRPPSLDGADETAPAGDVASAFGLGLAEVDAELAGVAAAPAGLHEIAPAASADAAAAAGFALALAARLLSEERRGRPGILWCQGEAAARESGRLYGPGLQALGLDPGRLLLVRARRAEELLWALEEGLRCGALAAVAAELAPPGSVALRRLALAAAERGTPALLLTPPGRPALPLTRSRWEVAGAPGVPALEGRETPRPAPPGRCRWHLSLTRCRGGRPGAWTLDWNHETGRFALAAPLADRPAAPRRGAQGAEAGCTAARRRTG